MSENAPTENNSAAKSPSSGPNPAFMMILATVNILGTIAIAVLLWLSFQKEKQKESVQDIDASSDSSAHGGGSADHAQGEAGKEGHGGGGGHGKEQPSTVSIETGKVIGLDPFTVNLSVGSGNMPRYLRVNISIELEKGKSDEEFNARIPRVRDVIISLIGAKRPTDLVPQAGEQGKENGKDRLKEDIKQAINDFMKESKVAGVYFTNFAISN